MQVFYNALAHTERLSERCVLAPGTVSVLFAVHSHHCPAVLSELGGQERTRLRA